MENKKVKIAIVEDDENLRFLVQHRLIAEGYQVIESANGIEAEEMIMMEEPDIVLLDWMLPGKSGAEICESVRKKGFTNAIIMVTAKAQDLDKIDAYNFGVNDYITKPFSMEVMIALVENKIKYQSGNDQKEIHAFGDMEHHPNTHILLKKGKRIELTILENRILLYFLKNPNKVINREELMMVVWGYNADVNTRTLDMHIVRLRKKIEENSENPLFLATVRGFGYRFNLD